MTPRLSIFVVSYGTRDLTLACLRSVFEQTTATPFELIVVDNQSSDGSADAIESEFGGRVTLIKSNENLGFARANNLAAERARGEYLLLLNPDTLVLNGAVDKLVAFARRRPAAGIWGGRTVFADGSLNQASCWGQATPWSVLCQGMGLTSLFRGSSLFNPEGHGGWKRDRVREVDIVSGCFLLIRRDLWQRLRGFDPAFFMYGEEADLCLRARKLRVRPVITPDATIVHHGGASERVRADKMVRLLSAKALLLRRHWGPVASRYGVAMLTLWPLTRLLAWTVLRAVHGARGEETVRTWREVWRRRDEWLSRRDAAATAAEVATA